MFITYWDERKQVIQEKYCNKVIVGTITVTILDRHDNSIVDNILIEHIYKIEE